MKPIKYCLFFITILSVILISSCKDDDCTDGSSEFHWTQNQSIEIDTKFDSITVNDSLIFIPEYTITPGQSNLFKFVRVYGSCKDIADTGGSSTFSMLVPADSTDFFSYSDQEIMETSAFILENSAFGKPNQSVEEGEISGIKLDDNSWRISINVFSWPKYINDYTKPDSIMIDEIFTLQ